MPVRNLRGEEVPVGKVTRTLAYHAMTQTVTPDWVTVVGAASETKDDVAAGRGECHLAVTGDVGGYQLPAFDPTAFRELRLRAALRHDMSDGATMLFGFREGAGIESPERWCYYRESGETRDRRGGAVSCGQLWYGNDGADYETGDVTIVLDGSDGCTILEVRVRPFERGVTVAIDGADRGNVIYEEADEPFTFDGPIYPQVLIEAPGSDRRERLSFATLELDAIHN